MFILFVWFAASLVARDISLEEWCTEIGGYYIPPSLSLQKTGPGECHCLEQLGGMPRRASPPNDRCRALTEERLCSNPAKFICQSEEANDSQKNQEGYFEAVELAKSSERVQALMKNWTWKKQRAAMEGRLHELEPQESGALTHLMNQELDKNYYQKNNRAVRVQEQFDRAKRTMLALLMERQTRFPAQKVALDRMIETIRRATYVIGWTQPTKDGLLPHNMAALTDPRDVDRPNKVLIGTVISELDTSPEGFYFGLLHEFSHFIDTRYEAIEKHPYQLELECLRNPGTMGAKTAQGGGKDQINESFADWLAMQAWLKEHPNLAAATEPKKYRKPKQSTYEKEGRFIDALDTWNAKGKTMKELREINAISCGAYRYYERVSDVTRENNKDEHPIGIDRAEALLSSPAIKRALGCSEKYILTMKKPDDIVPKGYTAYCGDDLHAPQLKWRPNRPSRIERFPPVEPQRQHERR